jgi:phage baseplate assembly protein W
MANTQTFVGFNTIGQVKKFTLTDFELVKRDLLNSFNIRQGEKPGRPDYGTTIWNFLFENQVEELQTALVAEIQRVGSLDPRLAITDIQVYPQENGILIELELQLVTATDAQRLSIFFDQTSRRAGYV